jgi:hypothetical protein
MKSFSTPVDINGTKILNLRSWKLSNPNKLYFDSNFERICYLTLKEANFNFEFHPTTREVCPKFESWALTKGKTGCKIFKSTVRPITYTSDFLVKCNNGHHVFIEAKGFFHKDARLRYKLFQRTLAKNEISLIAYDKRDNIKDLRAIIKIINEEFGGSTLLKNLTKNTTSNITKL